MEIVEVTAYRCQYCGSIFLSQFGAEFCEAACCKAAADAAEADEDDDDDF